MIPRVAPAGLLRWILLGFFGVVVCVFIFSVIGGLGETSAGETYVVNKKSGDKRFVARTTADTYTDTDGKSYKVDENDNITKIEG